jgi:hypothetical protein
MIFALLVIYIVVEERPGYKVNAKAASKKKTKQVE